MSHAFEQKLSIKVTVQTQEVIFFDFAINEFSECYDSLQIISEWCISLSVASVWIAYYTHIDTNKWSFSLLHKITYDLLRLILYYELET